MEIKKAKLTKCGCVDVTFYEMEVGEVSIKGKNIAHKDLIEALKRLVPYFAELTEQKEADSIDWENIDSMGNRDLLSSLEVAGANRCGEENTPSVMLIGKRYLQTQKVLNINTYAVPTIDNDWWALNDFTEAVEEFFYEVELYVSQRKWGVVQQEIDFPADEDPFAAPKPTVEVCVTEIESAV
jgi:hypothetical protein